MILPEWLRELKCHYPTLVHLDDGFVPCAMGSELFIRAWMCEGIPYAFKEFPAYFAEARLRLARGLKVNYQDIGVTGSGRLGYSMSPRKFGQRFSVESSDLDLFVINNSLHERIRRDALQFVGDYSSNLVAPRNTKEEFYWADNSKNIPRQLNRGFVDVKYIPLLEKYAEVTSASQSTYRFLANMRKWTGTNVAKSISIRVYKDWDSAIEQLVISFKFSLQKKVTS